MKTQNWIDVVANSISTMDVQIQESAKNNLFTNKNGTTDKIVMVTGTKIQENNKEPLVTQIQTSLFMPAVSA